MYKMLIVDDDEIIRMSLREAIDWESRGIVIVGEAIDGKHGLEIASTTLPDIIISDVMMPNMDGITMASELYRNKYNGIVIILSSFSDFEYARKSIDFGVFAYLLKPIYMDELLSKVMAAIEKLRARRESDKIMSEYSDFAPIVRDRLIVNLIKREVDRDILKSYGIAVIEHGVVIYVEHNENEKSEDENYRAMKWLHDEMCFLLKNVNTISLCENDRIIIITDLVNEDVFANGMVEILRNYEKNFDMIISVGLSGRYDNMESISDAYSVAQQVARNKIFRTINSVNLPNRSVPFKRIVMDAMAYIEKNYKSNVSVKSVSDALFVSESHLMHVLKDNLGKTFNDCLTEYRMIIAKELLKKGAFRINEVANEVGFSDVKYFSQVFKRYTGMTPSEYAAKAISS